jgi:hypothetical protein
MLPKNEISTRPAGISAYQDLGNTAVAFDDPVDAATLALKYLAQRPTLINRSGLVSVELGARARVYIRSA